MPQYQPPQKVAPASSATSSSPSYRSPEKTLWQQFKSSPAWKYMLLAGALLTAWAMWRHHQGQTTIYNDYTDAAITNLLPAAGVVLAFLMNWLELPRQLAIKPVECKIRFCCKLDKRGRRDPTSQRGIHMTTGMT